MWVEEDGIIKNTNFITECESINNYEWPKPILTVCFDMVWQKYVIGRRYESEYWHRIIIGAHIKINGIVILSKYSWNIIWE